MKMFYSLSMLIILSCSLNAQFTQRDDDNFKQGIIGSLARAENSIREADVPGGTHYFYFFKTELATLTEEFIEKLAAAKKLAERVYERMGRDDFASQLTILYTKINELDKMYDKFLALRHSDLGGTKREQQQFFNKMRNISIEISNAGITVKLMKEDAGKMIKNSKSL